MYNVRLIQLEEVNNIPGTLTATSLGGLEVVKVQDERGFINWLIYGESGIGKTTLAGSCDMVELLQPVIFIDIEGGTQSLEDVYPNVQKVRVTSWPEMQQVYHDLYMGGHPWRTIVLDSLTEIQRFNMEHVMQKAQEKSDDRKGFDPDVPAQRDWGVSSSQLKRMIRGFRDLPMNTIFTALAQERQDKKTGRVSILPDLPGKLAQQVPGLLDIVSYYYLKDLGDEGVDGYDGEQRILLNDKTEKIMAKSRVGKLPQTVIAPTMPQLFKLMYEGRQVPTPRDLASDESDETPVTSEMVL
jgi:hypothetical protein